MQGVDFMADCHGDEELPYNFVNGTEGIPSWDDRLERTPHQVSSFIRGLAAEPGPGLVCGFRLPLASLLTSVGLLRRSSSMGLAGCLQNTETEGLQRSLGCCGRCSAGSTEDLQVHFMSPDKGGMSKLQHACCACCDLRGCKCKAAGACVLPQQAPAPDAHTMHQHAAVRRQGDAAPVLGMAGTRHRGR